MVPPVDVAFDIVNVGILCISPWLFNWIAAGTKI